MASRLTDVRHFTGFSVITGLCLLLLYTPLLIVAVYS
jgi:spermidine/putrescine transport system permease protein